MGGGVGGVVYHRNRWLQTNECNLTPPLFTSDPEKVSAEASGETNFIQGRLTLKRDSGGHDLLHPCADESTRICRNKGDVLKKNEFLSAGPQQSGFSKPADLSLPDL